MHICEDKMLEYATWAIDTEIIGCTSFMGVDVQVTSNYETKTK